MMMVMMVDYKTTILLCLPLSDSGSFSTPYADLSQVFLAYMLDMGRVPFCPLPTFSFRLSHQPGRRRVLPQCSAREIEEMSVASVMQLRIRINTELPSSWDTYLTSRHRTRTASCWALRGEVQYCAALMPHYQSFPATMKLASTGIARQ